MSIHVYVCKNKYLYLSIYVFKYKLEHIKILHDSFPWHTMIGYDCYVPIALLATRATPTACTFAVGANTCSMAGVFLGRCRS